MRIESTHIEKEFKITVSESDFDVARNWMQQRFGSQYGARLYRRSRIYFDTPDRRLLNSGSSFRRNKKTNEYCLKVPMKNNVSLYRREFRLNSPDPIDLLNPLDRSLIIVRKLLPYIVDKGILETDQIKSFKPIIKIRQERELFPIFSVDGSRMVHIVFDSNTANSIESDTHAECHIWREIEIETHESFAEYSIFADSIAYELCDILGCRFQTLSKYALACELIGPHDANWTGGVSGK